MTQVWFRVTKPLEQHRSRMNQRECDGQRDSYQNHTMPQTSSIINLVRWTVDTSPSQPAHRLDTLNSQCDISHFWRVWKLRPCHGKGTSGVIIL